jgi:hypothetical protein
MFFSYTSSLLRLDALVDWGLLRGGNIPIRLF